MNRDFEDFLNTEKENFCKWNCKFNNLTIQSYEYWLKCPFCKEDIDLKGETNLNLDPCLNCCLDSFIKEIRDKKY